MPRLTQCSPLLFDHLFSPCSDSLKTINATGESLRDFSVTDVTTLLPCDLHFDFRRSASLPFLEDLTLYFEILLANNQGFGKLTLYTRLVFLFERSSRSFQRTRLNTDCVVDLEHDVPNLDVLWSKK